MQFAGSGLYTTMFVGITAQQTMELFALAEFLLQFPLALIAVALNDNRCEPSHSLLSSSPPAETCLLLNGACCSMRTFLDTMFPDTASWGSWIGVLFLMIGM